MVPGLVAELVGSLPARSRRLADGCQVDDGGRRCFSKDREVFGLSPEKVSNKGILGRIFGPASRQAAKSGASGAGAPGCCGPSKSPEKPSSGHGRCCDIRIVDLDEEENATDSTKR